jgi:hypothetical protein
MSIEPFAGKVCNKCHLFKTEYHKDSNKKDGFCTLCADCKRLNTKSWGKNNSEKAKSNALQYYYSKKDDPDFIKKRRVTEEQWRKDNPDKRSASEAKRRSKKLNATPPWLTPEQEAHIKRTYTLCQIASDATGEKYHVDHIVPLQGENVCGLHVPWNLRAVPAKINLTKGNKHD